jgi:glutaredoxin 3
MKENIIYTSYTCPYCYKAKSLLNTLGIAYKEISVDMRPKLRKEMTAKSGRTSVPQIWINDYHIGGCDDLYMLSENGKISELIQKKERKI